MTTWQNGFILKKFTSHGSGSFILILSQAITPRTGQRFLNSIGHCYTLGSIVKSELRILKTLDYHILITTPLTFLETILEILGKWRRTVIFVHKKTFTWPLLRCWDGGELNLLLLIPFKFPSLSWWLMPVYVCFCYCKNYIVCNIAKPFSISPVFCHVTNSFVSCFPNALFAPGFCQRKISPILTGQPHHSSVNDSTDY